MNLHSRIGRKMAGTRFMTLILVTPSMFSESATISREPTQVISAMTASPRKGWRKEASTAMDALVEEDCRSGEGHAHAQRGLRTPRS